jgi:hypothetical protein
MGVVSCRILRHGGLERARAVQALQQACTTVSPGTHLDAAEHLDGAQSLPRSSTEDSPVYASDTPSITAEHLSPFSDDDLRPSNAHHDSKQSSLSMPRRRRVVDSANGYEWERPKIVS